MDEAGKVYWAWSQACWLLARLDPDVVAVEMRGSQRGNQGKRGTIALLGYTYTTTRTMDLTALVTKLAAEFAAEWCGHYQLRLWGPNMQAVRPSKMAMPAMHALSTERHLRGKTKRNELWMDRPSTAHGMPPRERGW